METIKQSIQELSQQFTTKMAEFQQNLNSSIPAASPTSHLAAQFTAFRAFVMSALEGLHLQVQLLSKQQDQFEMRSRQKILLVHGVPEEKKEKIASCVVNVLSSKLKLPDLSVDDISRCHRLGGASSEKTRAIVIKFRDISLRNKVWFSKTNLKNTGITLSEFLTKSRHETFTAARQHFGITKCWTKNGFIMIIGPDGNRYSITSSTELSNIISNVTGDKQNIAPGTASAPSNDFKQKPVVARMKRNIRK